MLISYKRGQTSVILRVKILNSSVTTGAGLTGLTSASAGLIISTIADNEATATAYTQAGGTIETIATLGTYAAPTATKCRFKEVDATNHPGVYEIQLADARLAVAGAKSLLVSISGATNCAETDAVIPLTDLDPYDSVTAGLTALPNAVPGAAGGLFIAGTNAETTINTALNTHIVGNITGNLSGSVGTLDGHTVQTGDSYSIVSHATYGNAKLARTGADGDTLETLSDQIDGVSVSGASAQEVWEYSGTRSLSVAPVTLAQLQARTLLASQYITLGAGITSVTYTVTDAETGLPIAGVRVIVTTDLAGTNAIAEGTTNSFGKVTFRLNGGTYYLWRSKDGYDFVNPDTEVVP